jgi:hypothetical protein
MYGADEIPEEELLEDDFVLRADQPASSGLSLLTVSCSLSQRLMSVQTKNKFRLRRHSRREKTGSRAQKRTRKRERRTRSGRT